MIHGVFGGVGRKTEKKLACIIINWFRNWGISWQRQQFFRFWCLTQSINAKRGTEQQTMIKKTMSPTAPLSKLEIATP